MERGVAEGLGGPILPGDRVRVRLSRSGPWLNAVVIDADGRSVTVVADNRGQRAAARWIIPLERVERLKVCRAA